MDDGIKVCVWYWINALDWEFSRVLKPHNWFKDSEENN